MLTRLRGKRKAPKLFKPTSVDYDARIFYYLAKEGAVSLKTVHGRFRIPLLLGIYQKQALEGENPTSATLICKNGVWYIHMVVERKPCVTHGQHVLGIDLGITNIATASTGLQIEGKTGQQLKAKCAKIRASLQSKGSQGAKQVLKKFSGKEHRRIRHENHVLSKQLVEEARRHDCGTIRMEQLKEIRDRTRTWNKHKNRMVAGWSFYQLQQFVHYKAAAAGIGVEYIAPQYTSQTCHQCLSLGSRKGERFYCIACGESHADLNAACVISLGGVVCKPARISNVS
jgi:IS605 OrfB family transposase